MTVPAFRKASLASSRRLKVVVVESCRKVSGDLHSALFSLRYADTQQVDVCSTVSADVVVERVLGATPDIVLLPLTVRSPGDGIFLAMQLRETSDASIVYHSGYYRYGKGVDVAGLSRAIESELSHRREVRT
ncbi:hypothetical protein MRY87_11095 [bacterium]|nr:hypothetical protein [bacterium]